MLAREYDVSKGVGFFPCIVQPKLDGVRMLASRSFMISRQGNSFGHLDPVFGPDLHLVGDDDVVLDGELFAKGIGFQKIVSLVKKSDPSAAADSQLAFHVYDVILSRLPKATFAERESYLRHLFATKPFSHRIVFVRSSVARGPDDVETALDKYVSMGYEGVMLRNPASPYESGKRSDGLQKYKRFKDGEFEIVGFVEASGKDAGTVVFECSTASGARFRVRPTGTLAERRTLLRIAPDLIGKLLTVKYQELTDGDVPRFPVAVGIRDYE